MNAPSNELNLVKVNDQNAAVVCKNADLEDQSKLLLGNKPSLSDYIQSLLANSALKDVINVIAHALPAREAVYWACLCVRDVIDQESNSDDLKAIKAAEQWVYQPNDNDRYLNHELAENLEYSTAAAWVSNAVFWSGGSITPKKEAKVEPPDGVFGKAISGAINLASASEDPKKVDQLQKQFIKRGINIAQGGKGEIYP